MATETPPTAAMRYATTALDGDFTVHTEVGYVESGESFRQLHQEAETVEGTVFKAAMRELASGVVIVTTRVEDRPWGLTISSCCSLSLEPPQLLVSLRTQSVSCKEILRTERFGISILTARQRALAELGAAVGTAKFVDEFCRAGDCEPFESPIIEGALYHLDCSLSDRHRAGDHEILIGLVRRALEAPPNVQHDPLLYYDRSFWGLGQKLG
jgi:flavin reductase ActVB